MRRIVVMLMTVGFLVGSVPESAVGQARAEIPAARVAGTRYLDYFVSQFRIAGEESEPMQAVGGRLTWSLSTLLRPRSSGWLDRTYLGGYLTHTPEDGTRAEVLRYGAEADLLLGPSPLLGRVYPFVSLAVGAVRAPDAPDGVEARQLRVPATDALEEARTSLSLTPGIGARIRLLPGINLRGDARQVIDFRDGARHNLEISGGISVGA